MKNKYDLEIAPPNSYINKNKANEQHKSSVMNEIPDNVNKVKKRVIRGVIKHGTTSNQQS